MSVPCWIIGALYIKFSSDILSDFHYRYLFWTEWLRTSSQTARIGRSYSDGTNITYIRKHQLGWPNGLSIDTSLGRLWWCDAMFDRFDKSNTHIDILVIGND